MKVSTKSIEGKVSKRELEKLREVFQKNNIAIPSHYSYQDLDIQKGLLIGYGVPLSNDIEEIKEVKPIYLNWGDLSGHLTVYGTTRQGKTRLMVSMIRQVILRGMDLIVVEPKGSVGQETIAWILEFLEEAGRLNDFKYISPALTTLSMKYNPLFGLSNKEISSLIKGLIDSTKEQFFAEFGEDVIYTVLTALDFLEQIEGKDRVEELVKAEYNKIEKSGANFIDNYNHLSDPDLAERIVIPKDESDWEDIEPPYRTLVTLFDLLIYSSQQGMAILLSQVRAITEAQMTNLSAYEKNKLLTLQDEAIALLTNQVNKDSGYFSKVETTFRMALQSLATGDLGRLLCTVKVNPFIEGFKNKHKGQVIVMQPFPLKYESAADALVKMTFGMLTVAFGDVGLSGRKFAREIALFVDEGGSVLYPKIKDLFNKAGGLGLRIFIFTQSFADYNVSVGEEIATVINDNTNIKIYMKVNDEASRKRIADSFGSVLDTGIGYMGSKLDMRLSTNDSEKALVLTSHIALLQKQQFLLQTYDGFFLAKAPFQPDPTTWIQMPFTDAENQFKEYTSRINRLQDLSKTSKPKNNNSKRKKRRNRR
jgi:hypothetical protein